MISIMSRVFGLLLLAGIFGFTPFYLLSELVMPQLMQLQQTYQMSDEIAAKVAQ